MNITHELESLNVKLLVFLTPVEFDTLQKMNDEKIVAKIDTYIRKEYKLSKETHVNVFQNGKPSTKDLPPTFAAKINFIAEVNKKLKEKKK